MNWMKFKLLYFAFSGLLIAVGIYGLTAFKLDLGIDFTGGSSLEYKTANEISATSLSDKLKEKSIEAQSIQKSDDNGILLKLGNISAEEQATIETSIKELGGADSTLLRFEQVGPSLSKELIYKTAAAVLLATLIILGWIAYQFKSLLFGISATAATFHDAFILVGSFSLLGKFYGAEVDFLFITALLTTLSFSVHDTIVVFDRIREIRRKNGGDFVTIANRALSETMRRSIFNSLTIIIMLTSLIILGGETVRWFAVALLIGTVSGTYSSPFVAVPILVSLQKLKEKRSK